MSASDKTEAEADKTIQKAEKTLLTYATDYGRKFPHCASITLSIHSSNLNSPENPLPPIILATLITSLHARPFQLLPLTFAPILLFSTYLNVSSFVVDSAGLTAAWSGLYLLMASRRKVLGNSWKGRMGSKFGARGLTRGAAMGVAGVNLVGCGITYVLGERKKKEHKSL
jgi:hypothetical protein